MYITYKKTNKSICYKGIEEPVAYSDTLEMRELQDETLIEKRVGHTNDGKEYINEYYIGY